MGAGAMVVWMVVQIGFWNFDPPRVGNEPQFRVDDVMEGLGLRWIVFV
jgi:hypothetical protein